MDALVACAPGWTSGRLIDEALDVALDLTHCSHVGLFRDLEDSACCLGFRPAGFDSPLATDQDHDQFPWGLPTLQPDRFVLIENAGRLALGEGRLLGELGIASAVHLPIDAGPVTKGAIQLYYRYTIRDWDDRIGSLLRALGAFTLNRICVFDERVRAGGLDSPGSPKP